jgi:hypothetical protein
MVPKNCRRAVSLIVRQIHLHAQSQERAAFLKLGDQMRMIEDEIGGKNCSTIAGL